METETSDLLTWEDEQPEEVKPAPEIEPMEDKDLPGPFAVAGGLGMEACLRIPWVLKGGKPSYSFSLFDRVYISEKSKKGFCAIQR